MAQQMRVLRHQQLSAEAEQFAGTYQLGKLQAEYRVRAKKRAIILWSVLGFILACVLGEVALGFSNMMPIMIIFLLIALLFVGMPLYYIFTPVIYRSWRVYVCTEGFVFTRGNSKTEAFRWDQIEAMWQAVTRRYYSGIPLGTSHIYTVRRRDGVQVVLNDRFADVEELGNTISDAVTRYLLPQAISAYNAGNTITFGPLSISMQGVSNGKELLPWNQIKEMGVKQGVVTVRKEGKWLNWSSVQVARVPNIFVFMALVNHVLAGHRY